MAESVLEQAARYPLAAYNFRVSVDGMAMSFARVSGLQREHQTATYRHGLSFIEGESITKFHVDRYVPLTLDRGTVMGAARLAEWLEKRTKSSMEVSLCDEHGEPVLVWSATKVVPVKLVAPTFDAATNGVSIESLEVRAAGISLRSVV